MKHTTLTVTLLIVAFLVFVLLAGSFLFGSFFFPAFEQRMPPIQPQPIITPDLGNSLEKWDRIQITNPNPGDVIRSPLTITGQARGQWFFEATFPVVLTDWDGKIIAESYAQADGEWMTEEFVPFTATLEFETPSYGERGSLILQKSNPSGLPEYDDALEIPVRL